MTFPRAAGHRPADTEWVTMSEPDRPADHARLYVWRAWIAIVRDVLIILLILVAVFAGGRLVTALGRTGQQIGTTTTTPRDEPACPAPCAN